MSWTTVVGSLAALCSMVSFVPQAWRIVRTRDTDALSPGMYALTTFGFALWTAYGAGLGEWPLIVTNGVCFVLAAFILAMTLLPQPAKDKIADGIAGPAEEES